MFGIINHIIWELNLPIKTTWFSRPQTAMPTVILITVWKYFPFFVIIFLAQLQSIPQELYEAAKIDGASQSRIFWQIVLPISLPALATIGLFFAFAFWNDWFLAKMYLDTNRKDLYPLQYLLMSIESNIDFLQANKDFFTAGTQMTIPSETIRMAIVMVLVVPIACTYPFFQRYFISGLTIGAVKG